MRNQQIKIKNRRDVDTRMGQSCEHPTAVISAGTHRYTLLKHCQGKSISGPLREGKFHFRISQPRLSSTSTVSLRCTPQKATERHNH